MPEVSADIYTDGSCHTQYRIGTWVALIFTVAGKQVLSETVTDTTHNRMELMAVIKAIQWLIEQHDAIHTIRVHSDSQYVTGLPARKEKIAANNFTTGKGNAMQNADLVKTFFELIASRPIIFIKIKAHQKQGDAINFNREADMLCRKLLRAAVEKIIL